MTLRGGRTPAHGRAAFRPMKWFCLATDQGDDGSQMNLGVLYTQAQVIDCNRGKYDAISGLRRV
jgi:hypothetical protein